MTKYQQALLAGVAALAITAGSGFASAQTHGGGSMGGGMSTGGSSAGDQSPTTQATPNASGEKSGEKSGMSQHPGAGMQHGGSGSGITGAGMRPQAQTQPGPAGQGGKSEPQRHAQGAGGSPGESQRNAEGTESGKPSAAESQPNPGNHRAAQGQGAAPANGAREGANVKPENGGANGAREGANVAPSGSVKFSERQRTTIKRTIIDAHSAPRADHVDFNVRVGTVVPRGSIHIVPVPETLVRIEPRWRGFLYFVYEDEIVVVNPSDMHIVAVVAV